MSLESVTYLFTKINIALPLPYNTGRVIAYVNI